MILADMQLIRDNAFYSTNRDQTLIRENGGRDTSFFSKYLLRCEI
jgi:hypothetical protein